MMRIDRKGNPFQPGTGWYECRVRVDGEEALNMAKENEYDIILLDIMLPDEDGLQILKKLRGNTSTKKVPVIMLTAKGTEYDKVVGLDSGADDYIPTFWHDGACIPDKSSPAPHGAGEG